MPKLTLTHFELTLLFALLASVVLGVVGRSTDRERLRHAAACFCFFLVALFGLAWLMKLAHG